MQHLILALEKNCWSCEQSASKVIAKRATPMDGQLFLIKHLLILREQVGMQLSNSHNKIH